jgi:choloylglycine hydrolase
VGATGEDVAHAVRWKARYGSVAIYADNVFPMDGMNEKGLVAHTLYFTGGAERSRLASQKSRCWKAVTG